MMCSTAEPSGPIKATTRPLLTVFRLIVYITLFLIALTYTLILNLDHFLLLASIFLPLVATLLILGFALIILARLSSLIRGLKTAFILTGVAAVGLPVSAVLHNAVFALLTKLLGEGFWGYDYEADLFNLAIFVFVAMLIISIVCSMAIMVRANGKISA